MYQSLSWLSFSDSIEINEDIETREGTIMTKSCCPSVPTAKTFIFASLKYIFTLKVMSHESATGQLNTVSGNIFVLSYYELKWFYRTL